MRIVYFGTPNYAVPTLKVLLESSHKVVAVVCNNDKPVGRKHVLTPPPTKVLANEYNVPVLQYSKVSIEGINDLKSLDADLFVTCAFSQMLSKEVLSIPKLMTINLHASILPALRGAAPIQRAIFNGLTKTGVTIMRTDEGLDTGDIITQKTIKIDENDTSFDLFNKMADLSASMILKTIASIENNTATFTKQNDKKATYAQKLVKLDGLINWEREALKIFNQVKACYPEPTAYTFYNGEQIKIFKVKVGNKIGNCGQVVSLDGGNIEVATKNGSIIIKELQKAGSNKMSSQDFLRGSKIKVGDIFTNG